jgi:glucosamine--fructose-6-phosphate aminotransferase (isomerizing)
MLLALQQLAATCAGTNAISAAETQSSRLAKRILGFSKQIEAFAASGDFADYVFLAQGPFYPIAREAGLKVMEMSCSYGQTYHSLEFRHGPKAIVGPETCLTFFLSESGYDAEAEVLCEMKELGGTIVAVGNRHKESVRKSSDLVIEFDMDMPEIALLAPYIVPAQLLGFYIGIKKGLNPDEPRNLSRVVILD